MITIICPDGNTFGIDENNYIFIGRQSEPLSRIYLGKATTQDFTRILGYMKQLQIHMEQNSDPRNLEKLS